MFVSLGNSLLGAEDAPNAAGPASDVLVEVDEDYAALASSCLRHVDQVIASYHILGSYKDIDDDKFDEVVEYIEFLKKNPS